MTPTSRRQPESNSTGWTRTLPRYNAAVEAARQSAVTILGSYIDAAIAALPEREEYKQRQQQTKPQTRWVPFGQEQKMPYDWYGYVEFVVEFMATPRGETPGSQLADQWLSHWPDPYRYLWRLDGCWRNIRRKRRST